jgi:hypothetical protein
VIAVPREDDSDLQGMEPCPIPVDVESRLMKALEKNGGEAE